MSRNTKLQDSLDKLNKSLETLYMAIHRQHHCVNRMEKSVNEYFEIRNFLKNRNAKAGGDQK
ncbi:hypothetical protein PIL02S_03334 [Paenibacillus illinoisensis]|uniref:Uncharacterized protein n=1 Tax=Paenibacillus illinoisensis TaxID=59845 RepID=A0A2W0CK38_9BACL|nr:hypothetical protein PIL02S_03334 [Paenibacillus illinoisensis]